MRLSWCVVVGFVVVIASCAGGRKPPPAPPRTTSLALQIERYELSNGLRVVLVQDARAPEVQVTMRYQVGSIDDPPGQRGLAHLVEHLMFQQMVGERSVFARLQDHASAFNAYTSLDATTYIARARPDRLGELLSIDAIRLGLRCASITDAIFDRERAVVVNEQRLRAAATSLQVAIHEGLFPAGHPYRDSIAGSEQSIGSVTRAEACAFADARYAPRQAVLVVSGPVTEAQLHAALGKFFARLPARPGAAPAQIARTTTTSQATVRAHVDDDLVIVAWPLPDDLALRSQMRAIARTVYAAVDSEVAGRVQLAELGGDRDPMLALAVTPADDETTADALAGIRRGLELAPSLLRSMGWTELDELLFNREKQSAIHTLFAQLDDLETRDLRLAEYVIAGRDPRVALADEIRGLREMTRDRAVEVARTFAYARARIVQIQPSGKPVGAPPRLQAPVHDRGIQRETPDLAQAQQPATDVATASVAAVERRQLPNGLEVVLLPLSSVPALEVRLVFGSGSGDEPAGSRGAALLAAYGLTWDLRYLNDLLAFAESGGSNDVSVELDHTTFFARGMAMHLDYLLAGMRRWVREGRYDRSSSTVLERLRRAAKALDDDGPLTDAWRTALYGSHPFATAGLVRHLDGGLSVEDAEEFRAAHYTPSNATLIVAGRFDAALANRWIDYLFADWKGEPASKRRDTPAPAVASLAQDADTSQVQVRIAIPATRGSHAAQLIAADMLDEIASDVRHQLGASYDLSAALAETRLTSHHAVTGGVDAPRTAEALRLVQTRLAELRTDAAATAGAFVRARRRVLARLAIGSDAASLAARTSHQIARERSVLDGVRLANAVQATTLDQARDAIAELDLARAAILLRGPAAEVDRGFAELGRTATRSSATRVATVDLPARAPRADQEVLPSELEDALTLQPVADRLGVMVAAAYGTGKVQQHGVSGPSATITAGYRFDRTKTFGGRASIGRLSDTYQIGIIPDPRPIEVLPIAIGGFVQATGYDRLWGTFLLGLNLDRVIDDELPPRWYGGLGFGLEGGVDLLRIDRHRLGLYMRLDTELASSADFSSINVGLAYRQ